MRGWIMRPVYLPGARTAARAPSGLDRRPDDLAELADGVLEAVVDDDVRELVLRVELVAPRPRAAWRSRSPLSVPRPTSRSRSASREGGAMKTCSASGQRLADLARALDLDLQHHRLAGRGAPLELGAQRPVAPARVLGVLDERALAQQRIELLVAEERVVDALLLARPRVARGRRDAQPEPGQLIAQQPDQRPLADPRGAGDDDHARQAREP